MSREERITFCPKCHNEFKYLYETEIKAEDAKHFFLSCPFCNAQLEIDLTGYIKEKILRGHENGNSSTEGPSEWVILRLPEKLFPKERGEGTN